MPNDFSYTPDLNDPQLLLERRRAMEEGQRHRMYLTDELNRSGLLGSSVGLDQMNNADIGMNRNLEDITHRSFMDRRNEALQLYRDRIEFERKKKLMQMQANQGFLGDIGEVVGGVAGSFLPIPHRLRPGVGYDNFDYGSLGGAF